MPLPAFKKTLSCELDGLQDLELVGLLVLVLILVAPETDVNLALRSNSLRQGPPAMSVQDHFFQGLTGQPIVKSSSGRGSPVLDGPESQAQMSAGQGSIQGPTVSFQDLWQELVALREPPVVLQELLDPCSDRCSTQIAMAGLARS